MAPIYDVMINDLLTFDYDCSLRHKQHNELRSQPTTGRQRDEQQGDKETKTVVDTTPWISSEVLGHFHLAMVGGRGRIVCIV